MSRASNTALPLHGKVAIVTGASRGIGAAIAIDLASRGANVVLVYTSPSSKEKAEKVASDITNLNNGSKTHIVQADLAQIEAPEKIVASTREVFGDEIDILVNNAGVLWATPIETTTVDDYAVIFDVNVRAPLLMIKAVVPHLRKPGRIINISSIGARIGPSHMSLYAASKAAIEGMTRALAHELGGAGHTVNVVAPGAVESDMMGEAPEDMIQGQMKATAVEHRIATTDDIAPIVGWLAGDEAKWISGQAISASGGLVMP